MNPIRRRTRLDEGIGVLLALGDVNGIRDLVRRAGLVESELRPSHRAVLALHDGRPDAPETARRALLERARIGRDPGRAVLYQSLAIVTIYAGRLTAARKLTAAARAETSALNHLLEVPDAAIDVLLRDVDAATARLEGALDHARGNDVLIGTDALLALLVEVDRFSGDAPRARAHAQQLDEVAEVLRNPRASMYAAFGRALADDDTAAAAECMQLAHDSGQPFEVARLGLRLATTGLTDPTVLLEIYDFYGRLDDALLARAWTRSAMEARGVPVPGRAVTKAENERLLGQLLTEGLTNRQIASVLGSTEKSVEGRLGRLFSRTGYRSRIELATALLDGTFTP
jgi:DNA-binding CsgD family transcriptional regulator